MKTIKLALTLLFTGFTTMVLAQEMPPSLQTALKSDDTVKISSYIKDNNVNNCFGDYSLLSNAVRYNAPNCFALLIAKGANVNLACNDYVPPLMHAAEYGRLEMAKVLVAHGADANFKYTGKAEKAKDQTPASYAIKYKHPEVADYLNSLKK